RSALGPGRPPPPGGHGRPGVAPERRRGDRAAPRRGGRHTAVPPGTDPPRRTVLRGGARATDRLPARGALRRPRAGHRRPLPVAADVGRPRAVPDRRGPARTTVGGAGRPRAQLR